MKKLPALFIGRYQPFHAGHKKLMETVLKEGQDIIIGVRDTKRDKENPYNFEIRYRQIHEAMAEWKGRYSVMRFPDIDSVCYGRGVGYKIREIRLDAETEKVSATQIRAGSSNGRL